MSRRAATVLVLASALGACVRVGSGDIGCVSDEQCPGGTICDSISGRCAVGAPNEGDAGPDAGAGRRDGGTDAGIDGGMEAGVDGGMDAGIDGGMDAGIDGGMDAGIDGGMDAGVDGGMDAGVDGGMDAGVDGGMDAGIDGGMDAGVDGGMDAGVDGGMDAGTAVAPGGIGASCSDPASPPVQGTCAEGEVCVQVGTGMCTIANCTADTQCGTNGGANNICIVGTSTPNICLLACTPGTSDPCGRADFLCVEVTASPPRDACIPNCNTDPQICEYPTTCDSASGMCAGTPCGDDGSCASGDVCDVSSGSVCVPDCNMAGNECPTGDTCTTSGTCAAPGTVPTYQRCETADACVSGDTCGQFAGGGALCLQPCTMDSDCPDAGSANPGACGQATEAGQRYCDVTCNSGTGCPASTQCESSPPDAEGNSFCAPTGGS